MPVAKLAEAWIKEPSLLRLNIETIRAIEIVPGIIETMVGIEMRPDTSDHLMTTAMIEIPTTAISILSSRQVI